MTITDSAPNAFVIESGRSLGAVALAGLLVGFGTRLGSGCTSGHGVCGISRFSPRSLVATGTFIAAGMLTVAVVGPVVMARKISGELQPLPELPERRLSPAADAADPTDEADAVVEAEEA